jgi:Contractile injection system tape measure protein
MILLHPFLPRLFEGLGIAQDSRILQPEKALALLHYLTTGSTKTPEYELVLPKILCNIPLSIPIPSEIEITSAETDEATALLDAVIRHWEALRNTSQDGLRGTFLLRPGKLSLKNDGDWLLQVEPRTFDILLDQLPWGITMVKLPWMEKMIWVEWRG